MGSNPGLCCVLLEISQEILQQRFTTRNSVQRKLVGAQARLSVLVLGTINYTLIEHRPNRDLAKPHLCWRLSCGIYILLAMPHLPDDRSKRRQRLVLVDNKGIVLLFP